MYNMIRLYWGVVENIPLFLIVSDPFMEKTKDLLKHFESVDWSGSFLSEFRNMVEFVSFFPCYTEEAIIS